MQKTERYSGRKSVPVNLHLPAVSLRFVIKRVSREHKTPGLLQTLMQQLDGKQHPLALFVVTLYPARSPFGVYGSSSWKQRLLNRIFALFALELSNAENIHSICRLPDRRTSTRFMIELLTGTEQIDKLNLVCSNCRNESPPASQLRLGKKRLGL